MAGACYGTPDRASLRRSMRKKTHTGLQSSGTITQVEQTLTHIQLAQSTADNPTCQVCGESLTEGDQITLYLHKPAGSGTYQIGQCRCRSHDDGLTTLFTLGVRELIVEGRIGQCRDHATQQTWPVLLAPSIRLISAADTTTGRVVERHEQTGSTAQRQCERTHWNSDTADTTEESQLTLNPTDRTASTNQPVAQSPRRDGNG